VEKYQFCIEGGGVELRCWAYIMISGTSPYKYLINIIVIFISKLLDSFYYFNDIQSSVDDPDPLVMGSGSGNRKGNHSREC
jgi:hypothetical protein